MGLCQIAGSSGFSYQWLATCFLLKWQWGAGDTWQIRYCDGANGTRAHIPFAPPARRALEASEPLEAMRHESGAPTGATCHEPYRGQASMGVIEPYHFVGIGRQGPIALGEQLACFEWMKLHLQKFYSSCDTAQSTHENFFPLADGPKEGPLCRRAFWIS